jgi:hypothetical protein
MRSRSIRKTYLTVDQLISTNVPLCRWVPWVPIALIDDIRSESRTVYGLFDRVTFGWRFVRKV